MNLSDSCRAETIRKIVVGTVHVKRNVALHCRLRQLSGRSDMPAAAELLVANVIDPEKAWSG